MIGATFGSVKQTGSIFNRVRRCSLRRDTAESGVKAAAPQRRVAGRQLSRAPLLFLINRDALPVLAAAVGAVAADLVGHASPVSHTPQTGAPVQWTQYVGWQHSAGTHSPSSVQA